MVKHSEKINPFAEKRNSFAKKSLGQNFLVDKNYISRIIAALELAENDTVVEIGPGRGALTEKLVAAGARVVAIELDADLIPLLEEKFRNAANFTIFREDALTADFQARLTDTGAGAKLVANLPYYISTAILQKLIDQRQNFSELVVMLQKEVVERITAAPGDSERGFLTVLVEAFFDTEKLFQVPPTAFRPVPKVQSAVMRLITKKESQDPAFDAELFRELVSAGFRQKRKTILNNLKNAGDFLYKASKAQTELSENLINLEIDPQRRAETLTLDEWITLTNFFDRRNE